MLHPGVGDDDKEARNPGATEDENRRQPMDAAGKALFAEEKEAEESRLQEEREDAFHCEGHAYDAAGAAGELAPVRAKLELHRDAGNHAKEEIDGEDFSPETSCDIATCFFVRISGAESDRFENHY